MQEAGYAAKSRHGLLRHDDGALLRYWHPMAARCAAMAASRDSGGQELSLVYVSDYDLSAGVVDADDEYSRRWRAQPRSGIIVREFTPQAIAWLNRADSQPPSPRPRSR